MVSRTLPYLVAITLIISFFLIKKIVLLIRSIDIKSLKKIEYQNTFCGFWVCFLWYTSGVPLVYLSVPLIDESELHLIWISLLFIFFALFSRPLLGDIVTDIFIAIIYILCYLFRFPTRPYNQAEIIFFVFSGLYLIFLSIYTVPSIIVHYRKN